MDDNFLNEHLGPDLHWQPAQTPPMITLEGRYVRLEKLDPTRHGESLYVAEVASQSDDRTWLYMSNGPFSDEAGFRAYVEKMASTADPLAYAVIPKGSDAAGVLTYMRIDEKNGSIEIGHIWYGVPMQQTPATTEAAYLTAKHAFEDLGYRRFEWKCHDRNERSKRAALRLGFTYEGTFRNHIVARGRNRDTAWFAMTIEDWPRIKSAFEAWLAPANFDEHGRQRQSLARIREQQSR